MNPSQTQDRQDLVTRLGIADQPEAVQNEQLAILDEVLLNRILNKIPDWLSPEQMKQLDGMANAEGSEIEKYLSENIVDYKQKVSQLVDDTITELTNNKEAVLAQAKALELEQPPDN